jgi:hypothetical protein
MEEQQQQQPVTIPCTLPTLITHHWGGSIQFNLESVSRLKYANNSVVQLWFKDEEGRVPLVVRLKPGSSGYPWMIGHRGHDELFKSALVTRAIRNTASTHCVHVFMKTYTRRKGDPITRQFRLCFGSHREAKAFVLVHNMFLDSIVEEYESDCWDDSSEDEDSKKKDEDEDSKKKDKEDKKDEDEDEDEDESEDEVEVQVRAEEERRKRNWGYSADDEEESEEEPEEMQAFQNNTQDPFADYLSD